MNNNAFEVLADGAEDGELVSIEVRPNFISCCRNKEPVSNPRFVSLFLLLYVVQSFKFTGLVPDGKVSIQEENFNKTDYPSTVSLLACSGKYGYFVAGHVQGKTKK